MKKEEEEKDTKTFKIKVLLGELVINGNETPEKKENNS